jgi:3-oxoacyl-[acyl-carrier-protein] synthase-3
VTTSDLAADVLKKISLGEGPIYLSTISPDYLTPSTSSELKRKVGWEGLSPAIDLSAACAGFIFALEQASLFLLGSKQKIVYALAAELRSRFLDLNDRRTVFIFADAAAGCVLSQDKVGAMAQVLWTSCSTQSKVAPEIYIPAGGAKQPLTHQLLDEKANTIRMVDGVGITEAVEAKLVSAVQLSLQSRQESIEDYAFILFHQGNGQLIERVLAQLGLQKEQTHINFGQYGNSSSASVAVALSEAASLGKIKPGQKVLLVAMGAGYHLGVAGLTWVANPT